MTLAEVPRRNVTDVRKRAAVGGHEKQKRGPRMSVSAHVEELRKKHRTLSEQVEVAQRNPAADALELSDMKKQKLRIKEEITRLSQG